MKVSARHVFEARIPALVPGPVNAAVAITRPGGPVVRAVMTHPHDAHLKFLQVRAH
jgi:molybdopterin-binding protein